MPDTEKTVIQCTSVFIAALFAVARIGRQHKCPTTEEWIKKNETGSSVKTWRDPETVIENAVKQKDKSKYHILKHIYGI